MILQTSFYTRVMLATLVESVIRTTETNTMEKFILRRYIFLLKEDIRVIYANLLLTQSVPSYNIKKSVAQLMQMSTKNFRFIFCCSRIFYSYINTESLYLPIFYVIIFSSLTASLRGMGGIWYI